MPHPPKHADLLDRSLFPPLSELLGLNPHEHRCFLAQIISVESLTRLVLRAKDIDGVNVAIAWYTPGDGREIDFKAIRPGYTVAILEAEPHIFLDGSTGVRIEDPRIVKIFPMTLQAMQELSGKLNKYVPRGDEQKICHGCGKKSISLQNCARCKLFWYCDSSCQQVGWSEMGHKTDCKGLKDPDLRGLYLAKWEEDSPNRFRFPLNPIGEA